MPPDVLPLPMPIEHAVEELDHQIQLFFNAMVRDRRDAQLTGREWVREFKSFLDGSEVERHYKLTVDMLKDAEDNDA